MKRTNPDTFLLEFTASLKKRGRLPKNIEVCTLRAGTMANVYDSIKSEVINESVFCGVAPVPATAILKGLVEMVERRAYNEGFQNGISSCQTERSDGFAAFPFGIVSETSAKQTVRENALNEAIERFVWANWWDNHLVEFQKHEINLQKLSNGERLLLDLTNTLEIESTIEVRPSLVAEQVVIIYFAFLKSTGVISGGACGKPGDFESIKYRALAELLRHGIAIHKIKNKNSIPKSFYERRLSYFGLTEEGTDVVRARLVKQGLHPIVLPPLQIDCEVPHPLSDLVVVHRCYFENQPEFVGGKLERLCL